ncbi:MAG: NAD(P)(+) transhydrogenase (Re/Si-specific) subunit beta, partial [Proteobacteria bacterium]|nr:NAD(P)(+) transhydrogenase (Re/Si-specific) subunit beta [Pseudomonadota bacterium]
MSENLSAILYLIASVCFIMALRSLSSPSTARTGNFFGIAGMAIAVGTTLAQPVVVAYETIIIGVLIGGAIGTVIAFRIKMTAMPQLVAAFHSLVGLAAVLVAGAALNSPETFHIGTADAIKVVSRIEMSLGIVIGAITFTGSIVAFTKLQGLVSGAPLVFPAQHPLNLLIGISIIGLGA